MSTENDNDCSLIGDRITEERKKIGKSQSEVADFCNVSREMWGRYERNLALSSVKTLAKFAAMGADVQYILTGVCNCCL